MGILLGTAYGDSLGLPFEIMKPWDPKLLAWDGKTFLPSDHHSKAQPGDWSDDTLFSLTIAESLLDCGQFSPEDLSLRYVELLKDCRGMGKATRAALEKLKENLDYQNSGTDHSFGTGTAMRSSVFGVFFRNDYQTMVNSVTIDSKTTHKEHECFVGALAMASTAWLICNSKISPDPNHFYSNLNEIIKLIPMSKIKVILQGMMFGAAPLSVKERASLIGSSFDVRDVVPLVIVTYLSTSDLHQAVELVIRCGGDADSTGAMVGGLYGITQDIPKSGMILSDYNRLAAVDEKLLPKITL